jgi:PAS domain S-box-containing protein
MSERPASGAILMNESAWDDAGGLQFLEDAGVLDAPAEPAFDDIAALAAQICGASAAILILVAEDRAWLSARVGAQAAGAQDELVLAQRTMLGAGPLILPDPAQDDLVARLRVGEAQEPAAFVAAIALRTEAGLPLGALAVLDARPRPRGLTPREQSLLEALGRQAITQLAMMSQAARLRDNEARFRAIADSMPQMVWSARPDGFHDYFNARWYEFTGITPGGTDGHRWNGAFHPDDQGRAWARWRHSLATGEPYEIEYRLRRHDGVYRWTLGRALPIRDPRGAVRRWFGTCTDIDDGKRAAQERELVSHELSHRIKNIFSVVSGLISLSARREPAMRGFAEALRDRVMALGRAHDFVRPHSEESRRRSGPATIFAMLGELFAPYADGDGGQPVRLTGQDMAIDDRSATPLALVFHELATNAAKYGALSAPGGAVDLSGAVEADDYVMRWVERGGPRVNGTPEHSGFGSVLAQISVEGQLGGRLSRTWAAQGLEVELRAPVSAFARSLEPAET